MKHIHIIGIGGTFMGSLAALAQEAGFRVSGCDKALYPPMSTQLANLGIEVIEGYGAEQLAIDADVYVIGNIAKRTMPVVEAILNRGLPYTSGPQWLAEHVLNDCRVLAVAGTHGKTSTASMLAWILQYAGLHCGFLIGGIAENLGISARLPENSGEQKPCFVIEADEYDTAFFDKRSKFVHYRPWVAVLNNLEYDHADIFPDLAAIERQFHHFIRIVPSEGRIVCNRQDVHLQHVLAQGAWTKIDYFNDNNGLYAGEIDEYGRFVVFSGSLKVGEIHWELSGEYNQHNALAAIVAAHSVGVDYSTSCAALSRFLGVKRRMEIKGVIDGIAVYDDFAHHPTAIAGTLSGLRHRQQKARIIAVLEPRSNTMKLGTMKQALPTSLAAADKVFAFSGGVDWDVQAALLPLGDKVKVCDTLPKLCEQIVNIAQQGDHIVLMSNGSFGGLHESLIHGLKERKKS